MSSRNHSETKLLSNTLEAEEKYNKNSNKNFDITVKAGEVIKSQISAASSSSSFRHLFPVFISFFSKKAFH
jgi:hypothetical protein